MGWIISSFERGGEEEWSGVATSALVLQVSLQLLQLQGLRMTSSMLSLLCNQLAERVVDCILVEWTAGGTDR